MRVTFISFLLIFIRVSAWAGAEGFLELYGGPFLKGSADVRVSETTSSGTTSADGSIELSSASAFGLRASVWHPTYNWIGIGMDAGYLTMKGPGVDITALPLSFLLALRVPLFATPEIPSGRLQPYGMAGVSFYSIDASVQFSGVGGSTLKGNWLFGSSGPTEVGPYLAAGLAWQLARNFALFGEYRYTTFDVAFDTTNSFLFPTANGHVDTTVTTQYILFGISYRMRDERTPGKEANP